jgi:RHS repeat-associated protein
MRRLVAVLISLSLAFGGLLFASPAMAVDGEAKDVFSARVIAKATHNRVLITGLLDEFSTTYVNPDGTLTTDSYGSAIRVRDDRTNSGWRDLDYDLVFNADGSASPKSGLYSLFISGGGSASEVAASGVVRVTSPDGSLVGFSWPSSLPKPVLDGPKAVFSEVLPGVDLVVEATASGFEQFFVLKVKPSAEILDQLELPLKMKKVKVVENLDGSFSFENAAASEVASLPTPRVWDSSLEPKSGNSVEGVLDANLNRETNTVELAGLGAFLENPDLVYPVTVDPALTLNPLSDNYVRDDTGAVYWSSSELLLGTFDGGSTRARTYLRFRNTAWVGKQIISSSLKLYETWSYSCNARAIHLYPIDSPVTGSWSWAKQPVVTGLATNSLSVAKGYSSACAAGWVTVPATSVVSWMATNPPVEGSIATIAVRASETDSYGWKRFSSSNTTNKPVLSVTYNNLPTEPSVPTISPGQYVGGLQYATSLSPTLSTVATDGDKDQITYTFYYYPDPQGTVNPQPLCSTPSTASGSVASCQPTFQLADNQIYHIRAVATDSLGSTLPLSQKPTSYVMDFKTAVSTPIAPAINCSGYANTMNVATIPTSEVNCSVSVTHVAGSSDANRVQLVIDSGTPQILPVTAGSLTYSFVLPAGQHGHYIQATALTAQSIRSNPTTYTLSFGAAGVYAPTSMIKTASTASISAFVTPSLVPLSGAFIEWASVDGKVHDVKQIPITGLKSLGSMQGLFDYRWNVREVLNNAAAAEIANGGALDLRAKVCFQFLVFGLGETKCTPQDISILLTSHAFSSLNPTASAGSGTVSLINGELMLPATDASQSLPEGSLSISRQYMSFEDQRPAGLGFGPGWSASFSGIDAGAASMTVTDTTESQKLITLMTSNGDSLVYKTPAGSSGMSPVGTYVAYDQDTQASLASLKVVAGTPLKLVLTESDGRSTTWQQTVVGINNVWLLKNIVEATQKVTNSYSYDSLGRVTRILGPAPNSASCNMDAETRGCKALYVTYAIPSDLQSGDYAGQVKAISYKAFNPADGTMKTVVVARYTYDSAGYLTTVTDPRSGITTTYTYATNAGVQGKLLASVGQNTGLAATYYSYDSQARLLHVSLDKPGAVTGKDVVSTFVYNITNPETVLPATTAALWDETVYPKTVAAVFGADAPTEISQTTTSIDLGTVSMNSMRFGSYYFANSDGLTINQANYGKTSWRYSYTKYDSLNQPIAQFDANGLEQIIGLNAKGMLGKYSIYQFATVNKFSEPVFDSFGTQIGGGQIIETWEPTKPVDLGTSIVDLRLHTVINYDENEPTPLLGIANNIHHGLETSRRTTLADGGSSNWNQPVSQGTEKFVTQSVNKYAPIDSALNALDPTSGWVLNQPTVTQTLNETGAIIGEQKFVFDTDGRTVKTIDTKNATNPLLTTNFTYYSDTTNPIADCGNKPEWAGLVCVTGSTDGLGRQQPDIQISSYDFYLRPLISSEIFPKTNGFTNSRTTETSYVSDTGAKAFGAVASTKTSAIMNGSAVPGTTTVSNYDAVTGLLSSKTVGSSTTTYSYDKWGRKTALTNTPETGVSDTTTWGYIPTGMVGAGQVSLVTTPKSSYTYSYGGNGETRSIPTSLTVSGLTEPYTANYDEAGRMVSQTAPGGVSQTFTFDSAGRVSNMSYLAKVSNGSTTTTVDWMDFTRTYDAQNRVSNETTPGVQPGINNDTVYQYLYSDRNRLVNVNQIDNNICINRAYTFDNTGNRTQKVSSVLDANNNICGSLVTGETPVTQNLSYNNYSQITNSGYVYDIFGRATTIPSGDTANLAGDVTVGYSIEDRITSQKQGATQTNYSYDALGRHYQDKQNTVVQVTRYYSDESDNPTWVTSGPTGALTQTDVYTPSLGSSLNVTSTTKTSTVNYLNIANLHGDTITSLPIPTTGYVSAPSALNVFDEYGVNQPIDQASLQAGSTYADSRNLFINNYGSLGQAQRETTDTGIQFMGARGYNPITGQFLTPDPARGGNETPYNYPNNPINQFDTSGNSQENEFHIIESVALVSALVSIVLCARLPSACLESRVLVAALSGLVSGYFISKERGYNSTKTLNLMATYMQIGVIGSFGGIAFGNYTRLGGLFTEKATTYWTSLLNRGLDSMSYSAPAGLLSFFLKYWYENKSKKLGAR